MVVVYGCQDCARSTHAQGCPRHSPNLGNVAPLWWGRRPFECPICKGRQTVPAGFYTLGQYGPLVAGEPCRTCDGSGVLWGR